MVETKIELAILKKREAQADLAEAKAAVAKEASTKLLKLLQVDNLNLNIVDIEILMRVVNVR